MAVSSRSYKRKALVIGINYDGDAASCSSESASLYGPLRAPRRDAMDFRNLLIDLYNYNPEDVVLMCDDSALPHLVPTKQNMLPVMRTRFLANITQKMTTGTKVLILAMGHEGVGNEEKYIMDNPALILPWLASAPAAREPTPVGDTDDYLDHYTCNNLYRPWISKGLRGSKTLQMRVARKDAIDLQEPERKRSSQSPLRLLLPLQLQRTVTSVKRACTLDGRLTVDGAAAKLGIKPPKRSATTFSLEMARGRLAFGQPGMLLAQAKSILSLVVRRCLSPESTSKCDGYCVHAQVDVPHVISVSACNDAQSTWERGKKGSATQDLIEVLRANPHPTLQQLYTDLSYKRYEQSTKLHDWSCRMNKRFHDGKLTRAPVTEAVNFSDIQIGSQEKLFHRAYHVFASTSHLPGPLSNTLTHANAVTLRRGLTEPGLLVPAHIRRTRDLIRRLAWREAHEGNVWCLQCIACSFYKALDPLPMSLRDAVAGRTCSPYSHTASGVPTGRQRCPTCDKKAIACFSPPLPHKGFCTVPFRWIMPCNDNAGRYTGSSVRRKDDVQTVAKLETVRVQQSLGSASWLPLLLSRNSILAVMWPEFSPDAGVTSYREASEAISFRPRITPRIDGAVHFSPPMSSSAPDDLENELLGRIEYDNIEVFHRLKLRLVDENLVHQCCLAFDRDDCVTEAKDKLKTHVAFADGLSIDDLDDQQCRSLLNSGERELEIAWIAALGHRTFFDFITDFSSATCLRRLVETSVPLQEDDSSYTLGFPKAVPDFSLLNEASLQAKASEQPYLWSDTHAFCVVKPSNKQSPKPGDPSNVVSLITLQSSQYARLNACSRPFRLFAVCLIIFGSGFCVGIFDRGGLMLSPIYDMWEHTDVFIRVIRSLTSVVIDVDLGQYPTVRPLPNEIACAVLEQSEPPAHTSYLVEPIGDDERVWCTIGSPVWSSLSLFGRGTWVWYVHEYDVNGRCLKGAKMIMKTAWRQGNRSSESIIHRSIKGEHHGLAKLLVGADVEYRAAGKRPERMSVQYLRLGQNDVNDGSPHRWATTMGIRSELELLLGVRAALDAHEFLCDQGIVHRDISRSNILLRDTKYDPDSGPDGGEGFLIDLEFAGSSDVVTATEDVGESRRTYSRWIRRGALLTQTFGREIFQFMALDILRAIKNGSTSIEHTASHDVESFIWVLGYCVLRKLVNALKNKVPCTNPDRIAVEEAFDCAFGHANVHLVLISRMECLPLVRLPSGRDKQAAMSGLAREYQAARGNDAGAYVRVKFVGDSMHRANFRNRIGDLRPGEGNMMIPRGSGVTWNLVLTSRSMSGGISGSKVVQGTYRCFRGCVRGRKGHVCARAPADAFNVELHDLPDAAFSALIDSAIESFAEKEPGVSFVHIHPGVVRTRLLHPALKLLFYPFMTSPEDWGERGLAPCAAIRRDVMGMKRYYGMDEARTRLWEHAKEQQQLAVRTTA
ncbi:predicted protein [Postia placenta Mad-698-R]|nr:predicted protein [Postia placenta Mad-698-R]